MIRPFTVTELNLLADIISKDSESLENDLEYFPKSERRDIKRGLARRLRLARRVAGMIQLKKEIK